MFSILKYAEYPTPEAWDKIYERKKESFDKIHLKEGDRRFDFFDFQGIELSYWIREFNNRTFDLANNYVMLMNYYLKGIPDDEWYISPGPNGESIRYFPHFEEKHYGYLYWFGFYMDSYYSRFFSLIDTIYHLINVKYDLDVEAKPGFRQKILKKLETINITLYKFLNSIKENEIYKKIEDFRNNLTHNFRPNQVDSGINRIKRDGKLVEISMTVGNYTTTTQFVNNIELSIDLMGDIIDVIKGKIEPTN